MHRKSRIIGYRKNGCPIWLVMGGSGEGDGGDQGADDAGGQGDGDDDAGDGDGQDDDAAAGDDDKPLGPKGEKALQSEKEKRRAAQAELRQWKNLGVKPEDIAKLLADQKKGDAGEPDVDEIRRQAQAEARAETLRERVLDKIETKAARGFADPEDAAALVMRGKNPDDFLDDGKVDVEAIEEALEELLKKKPYLAAQGGKRFQGSGDGGARPSKPQRPKSIAEAVAKKLNAS